MLTRVRPVSSPAAVEAIGLALGSQFQGIKALGDIVSTTDESG